jgi:hypothetical protein
VIEPSGDDIAIGVSGIDPALAVPIDPSLHKERHPCVKSEHWALHLTSSSFDPIRSIMNGSFRMTSQCIP